MNIGIDISKDTFDIAYFDNNVWHRNTYEQTTTGYELFIIEVGKKADWFVMEATGVYFLNLAKYLSDNGFKVAVINPKCIHHYGKMRLTRAKTDRKDAELIARYAMDYHNEFKNWELPNDDIIYLTQLRSCVIY
jgi:transposase